MTTSTIQRPVSDDWGVFVDECRTYASRTGSDWWATYCIAHARTGRVVRLDDSFAGGHCHVACDDRDDAEPCRDMMIERGMRPNLVQVETLAARRAIVRRRHAEFGADHSCSYCAVGAA